MARLLMFWNAAKDSLWFIPALLTLASACLGIALTELERAGFLGGSSIDNWFFGGGVSGARGVLGAIASGLITVTGVVFSVTIVALQLASSQYTPRVLRSLMADRGNQLVLGVFIGTFTYSLLVMRTIRSPSDDEALFIPRLSVTVAVLMVITCIGFLIYFIDHVAKSMQISFILERATHQTLRTIERQFPEELGQPDRQPQNPTDRPQASDTSPVHNVVASDGGYLQAVDATALSRIGESHQVAIHMQPFIGEFVLKGSVLATVVSQHPPGDELRSAVRRAFVLGMERTPEQDVELGIIGLSDIAVRALSPGINDPTTAMSCIDRLSEVALALGSRRPPIDQRTLDGTLTFVARHTTFARAMGLAFDQIRLYAAGNPGVVNHAVTSLQRVAAGVPEPNRLLLLDKARSFREGRSIG